jgi:hypothetical protein
MRTPLFALSVCLLAAAPASAQRVPLDPHARIAIYAGTAFGGESNVDGELPGGFEGTATIDLDASFVAGVRYEKPLVGYFMLGANMSILRYQDEEMDDRRTWLDLGVSPTLAIDIEVGNVALEPRLSLPLGFSLHVFRDSDDELLDFLGIGRANPGLYIGGLAGLGVYFSHGFGLLLEAGYMHHHAFREGRRRHLVAAAAGSVPALARPRAAALSPGGSRLHAGRLLR